MKVQLIISGVLVIRNLPEDHKQFIFDKLTIPNKKYIDALKYGRYVGQNTPRFLRYYIQAHKGLTVPKGFIFYIKKYLTEHNIPYEITDETKKRPLTEPIKFNATLRPYQEEALQQITKYPVGILSAKTGAGKTQILIALIHKRQQKTLVIVHNKELLNQWRERIKSILDYEPGLVGAGYFSIKQITVGIINSVKSNLKYLKNQFGQIIVDEVHRAASNMFTDILPQFDAKYTNGCSATVYRSDGLDNVLFYFMGPLLHTVSPYELTETKAVLIPKIKRLYTKFYSAEHEYAKLITELSKNEQRNNKIVEITKTVLENQRFGILIAVERVEQGQILQKLLKDNKIEVQFLTSEKTKRQREIIVEKIKEEHTRVLIATISLIGEGFDAPNLETLILAAPINYKGRLIQVAGRILRPYKDKRPLILDLRETLNPILAKQARNRDKTYRDQKWI